MSELNPAWVMVGLVLAGQIGGAVWLVAAVRGEVRRLEHVAHAAHRAAVRAHGRIDTLYEGRRPLPRDPEDYEHGTT